MKLNKINFIKIKDFIFNRLNKIRSPLKQYKISYAQSGEDIILDFLFTNILHIPYPSYIDIGAHHPFYLNNTAYFYRKGSRGINIEPNINLYYEFLKYRKKDLNLNIGISDQKGEADFYIMSSETMSTLSREEAIDLENKGYFNIREITRIKIDNITNVIKDYSNGKFPDFLTLDAEGLDEVILKSIDYQHNYPKVICVETLSYTPSGKGKKDIEYIQFLEDNGYFIYADTYINSIMVKKDLIK